MSAQGWHLNEVEAPFFYTFEQGDSADYVYQLDYYANTAMFANVGWYALGGKSKASKATELEYQQIFKDAGWTYLGTNRGWRYFRQAASQGQVQELYTDHTSKITKYRRQIVFQLALLAFVLYFAWSPTPNSAALTISWAIPRLIVLLIFACPLLPLFLRFRQLQSAP